jgi:hypothetical protein
LLCITIACPISGCHLPQERTFLCKDEPILLGKTEIRHALLVAAQPRAISLVGGEVFERDQRECDVVGAFMRHPIALQIARRISE